MAQKRYKTRRKLKGGWNWPSCFGKSCIAVSTPGNPPPEPPRANAAARSVVPLPNMYRNPLNLRGVSRRKSSRLPPSVVSNQLSSSILTRDPTSICNVKQILAKDPDLTEYTIIPLNQYNSYASDKEHRNYLLKKYTPTESLYCVEDDPENMYIDHFKRNGKEYKYSEFIFYINTGKKAEINSKKDKEQRIVDEKQRKEFRSKTKLTLNEASSAERLGFDRNFIVPKIRYLANQEEINESEYNILLKYDLIKEEQYRPTIKTIQNEMRTQDINVYINIAKEKAMLLFKKDVEFEEAALLKAYGVPLKDIQPKLTHFMKKEISVNTYESLKKYNINLTHYIPRKQEIKDKKYALFWKKFNPQNIGEDKNGKQFIQDYIRNDYVKNNTSK